MNTENRHIETFEADWHGIALRISWEPSWLNMGERLGYDTAHLQIEATRPDHAALPITETGYRSHFTTPATVAAFGGPVAFVLAWLDEGSVSADWKRREQEARQFSLF